MLIREVYDSLTSIAYCHGIESLSLHICLCNSLFLKLLPATLHLLCSEKALTSLPVALCLSMGQPSSIIQALILQVAAEPLQEQLRQMAISLLCGMVHSTWSTRMALWNCNGLHTLLELLKEEVSCSFNFCVHLQVLKHCSRSTISSLTVG